MKKAIIKLGALVALASCVQYHEVRKEVDLNKDGRFDVVELKDKAVYVQLGLPYTWEGKPLYTEKIKISEDFNKVTDLEIGDYNEDGILDLRYHMKDTSNPYSRQRFGKGDGTFTVELIVQ